MRKIPLFRDLPDRIFYALDLTGFQTPDSVLLKLIEELEAKIKCYIVPYKANVFNLNCSIESHLCALLKGTNLNKKKLSVFWEYEAKTKQFGVTLVAYKKPFRLIPIKSSAVYKHYSQKGLL